jgi:hypothetical protein
MHVPDSESIMVAEAGRLWLKSSEAAGVERSVLAYYRQHLELHIIPLVGAVRLSRLTVAMVRSFEDELARTRSAAMVRRVRTSLGAILADAQERGLVGQNVVRNLRSHRRGKEARPSDARTLSSKSASISRRRTRLERCSRICLTAGDHYS